MQYKTTAFETACNDKHCRIIATYPILLHLHKYHTTCLLLAISLTCIAYWRQWLYLAWLSLAFNITSTLGICAYKCAPVYMKSNSFWQASSLSASQIIPLIYGIRNFISEFTKIRHWRLFRASHIPSTSLNLYLLNLILPYFLLFRNWSRNFKSACCVCVCVSVMSVHFGTVEWFSINFTWAIFH